MFSALKKLLGFWETKKRFEAPLFSGCAYFSNRVPTSFLQKWVRNGGELSSGATLDSRARYFFATDPLEPWVTKLFARSVVVIHAGWIAHCVDAAFQVPIAAYILDDKFVPGYPYRLTDYFSPSIYVPLSEPGPTFEPDEFGPMSTQTSDTPSTPASMPRKRKREHAYFDSPSGSLVFSGFDKDGIPRRPKKLRKLRFDPSFSPDGGKSSGEMVRGATGFDWLRDHHSASRDGIEIDKGRGQGETRALRGPNFMATMKLLNTPEKPLAYEGLSAAYQRFCLPEHISKPSHVSSPAIFVDKQEKTKLPPVRTIDFTNLPPRTRRWRFPDTEGKKPGDKDAILSVVKSTEPKVKTPKKISFAEHARVCVYDVSPRSDAKDTVGTAPACQSLSEGFADDPEVDSKTRASTDEAKGSDGLIVEATTLLVSCTDFPKIDDHPTLLDEDQLKNDTLTVTMEELQMKRRHLLESTGRNSVDDGRLLTFFELQKTFRGMQFHVVW